jgi:hypothetical protein
VHGGRFTGTVTGIAAPATVSTAAHKLKTEATSLPALGPRRNQIFGITRAKVAQIDAAVVEALRI